ncbi:MAG TPA: hypothetical protein DHW82_11080 [Spirochaetia bacterium]|nr:MAG: hypothetical protein A2Y41_01090 [Spirochaetes bacterium GWB1_36_13]HCL57535.1 hypothetical protein [Spirochaetia bacterium]
MNTKEEQYVLSLESLIDIASSMIREKDLKKIMETALISCMGELNIKNGFFYLKKLFSGSYEMVFSKAPENKELEDDLQAIGFEDNIVRFISEKNSSFIYEPVIFPLFSSVGTRVILPLKVRGLLIGFVLLGEKYFGNFQKDDFAFLDQFSQFVSYALENAMLYSLITHDIETGLYHSEYFKKRINEAIYEAKRYDRVFSLALIEIDDFSEAVKTHGDSYQTQILSQLSSFIQRNLRITDLIFRLKDNRLAIILPDTTEQDGSFLCERLRNRIEKEDFMFLGRKSKITASVGIAEFNENIEEIEFMECAVKALQLAKDNPDSQTVSYSDYLRESE